MIKTNKFVIALLGVSSVVGLSACQGGSSSGNSTANLAATNANDGGARKLQDGFFALRMGSGYDTSSNTATSGQSCLVASADQNNIYMANPQALITFDQVQNLSALQKALGVDVSSKFGGDRFSLSLSSQFASSSKDNAYATNIVYLYKYTGQASFVNGSLKQGDDALTSVARSLVHTNQDKFRQMCGNTYVEQMDAGAVLGVRLTLAFNSHSDKEKFNAKLNMQAGLAEIGAEIKQAAQNSNVHVGFSISAIQLGGEPQKLNNIFGEKDPSGNYPFVNCGSVSGSSSDACNAMISSIVTYGKSMETQLTKPDGSINLNNLYYTNPIASNYSTLGIIAGAPNPSADVLQAMQDLTQNYDQTQYSYNFVNHYLSALGNRLDTPTAVSLKDAAARLGNQLSNVYLSPAYDLVNCYKGYVSENCLSIRDNVEQGVANYALTDVQTRLLDYLQHNSYKADLYVLGGVNPHEPNSYVKTNNCVLAPISSPTFAKYAIYCDGAWLDTTGNFKIRQNSLKHMLDVTGLYYYSVNSLGNKSLIQYYDTMMNPDSFDENYYYIDRVNVKFNAAGGSDSTSPTVNSDLGLTLSPQNDA